MSSSAAYAACGSVEGFVRASLGFLCSKISDVLTTFSHCENENLEFEFFMAFSATVSRLLPLQLEFEPFQ